MNCKEHILDVLFKFISDTIKIYILQKLLENLTDEFTFKTDDKHILKD